MDVDWGHAAVLLAVLVPSVILHEVSHGYVAHLLGDDTARRAGRLTLNPLAHVDPFGTVVLPILLTVGGLGAFGYAKPVPVDVGRLRRPRQHSLYVSLVGPAVNIVLAVGAAVAFRTLFESERVGGTLYIEEGLWPEVVLWLGVVNVVLAAFNLLPLPPLDGSALVERVLPARWWPGWLRLRRYSMGILLLVVLLAPGALGRVLDPALRLWSTLL